MTYLPNKQRAMENKIMERTLRKKNGVYEKWEERGLFLYGRSLFSLDGHISVFRF